MKHPVHFITRGDVFSKAWVRKIFFNLNMIPIFRIRDGKEKLAHNDQAFDLSMDCLRKGGILLVFVEGFCINQTQLQTPLKKHAPRIMQACWAEGIPVRMLPLWLNYSNYNRLGKTIDLSLGQPFGQEVQGHARPAAGILRINQEAEQQLLALSQGPFPVSKPSIAERIIYFFPAMLAAVVHAPYYLPIRTLAARLTRGTVHYDSIMLGFSLLLYPLYVVVLASLVYLYTHSCHSWWLLLIMPLLARIYMLWRRN